MGTLKPSGLGQRVSGFERRGVRGLTADLQASAERYARAKTSIDLTVELRTSCNARSALRTPSEALRAELRSRRVESRGECFGVGRHRRLANVLSHRERAGSRVASPLRMIDRVCVQSL